MSDNTARTSNASHSYPRWVVNVARLVLSIAIIAAAIFVYKRLMATQPKHQRRKIGERAVVVETRVLQRVNREVTVSATGTVIPARTLTLAARVGGEVVAIHQDLEPGGFVKAGSTLVQLDRVDYELALRRSQTALAKARNGLADAEVKLAQSRSQLVQVKSQETQTQAKLVQARAQRVNAEYAYKLELGQQDVAKHQWKLVDDHGQASDLDRELTLRKPHLRKAQAAIDSAQAGVKSAEAALLAAEASVKIAEASIRANENNVASAKNTVADAQVALELAELNLERTAVKVPFDAVVLERTVTLGTQVSAQTKLASLVATDFFWVEVSLPLDRVSWVEVAHGDKSGATAVVRPSGAMSADARWQGRVVRRLPQLESNGRQARLLLEVPNPLKTGKLPLLLDSFVKVDLRGPQLRDVFVIPRETVHNGKEIWVRNPEGRLEIKQVTPIWNDADIVVIANGLKAGEQLITSDVASPIPGMKVALAVESAGSLADSAGKRPGKPGGRPGRSANSAGKDKAPLKVAQSHTKKPKRVD